MEQVHVSSPDSEAIENRSDADAASAAKKERGKIGEDLPGSNNTEYGESKEKVEVQRSGKFLGQKLVALSNTTYGSERQYLWLRVP
jgi:hypothetical protein